MFSSVSLGPRPDRYAGDRESGLLNHVFIVEITRRTLIIAFDAEIQPRRLFYLDADGKQFMELDGERESSIIANGKHMAETTPAYEPKLRELTDQELAELRESRDRNLDDFEKISI